MKVCLEFSLSADLPSGALVGTRGEDESKKNARELFRHYHCRCSEGVWREKYFIIYSVVDKKRSTKGCHLWGRKLELFSHEYSFRKLSFLLIISIVVTKLFFCFEFIVSTKTTSLRFTQTPCSNRRYNLSQTNLLHCQI